MKFKNPCKKCLIQISCTNKCDIEIEYYDTKSFLLGFLILCSLLISISSFITIIFRWLYNAV